MKRRSLLWLVGLLGALTSAVSVHEKGVIRLDSKEVRAGGELGLRGEKLPKSATLRLELRGTLETFLVADVRSDAAGRFQARLALPPEAHAGGYTVVAVAPDGDVVARAELAIVAAAPAQATGGATMDGMPPTSESPHPTSEMMKVAVATTGGEWAVILTVIAASLGGALALLRGAARRRV